MEEERAAPAPAVEPSSPVELARRAMLRVEVLLVLGLSLGRSAVYAIRDIIALLTQPAPLNATTTVLNPSLAPPGRPWLDLANQLLSIFFFMIVPALLAVHLLNRDPVPAGPRLGLDTRQPSFDLGTSFGLAAVIGIPGLGLYVWATTAGINTTISAANLPDVWWAIPIYVLRALGNGVIEEVIIVGYLVTRLGDLGWKPWQAVATSSVIRGAYHLYQGFGGFIGNAIMGVVFSLFFLRYKRVLPLVIAHWILDVVAFVGYLYLAPRLSWI